MNNDLTIIYRDLSELIPYDRNPRNNEAAVGPVAESIRQFGFKCPIIIDGNDVIVAGHTRLLAAKKLGLDKVPCVVADDLTEEQIKAFRLADNKVSELAEWNADLLGEELKEITDIDMSEFGFELSEFDVDTTDIQEGEVPDVPEEAVCKLGDLWELGEHRLICGDSTDINVVDRLVGGQRIDLVFTDPPYNIITDGGCKGEVGKALRKQGKDIEFIADFEPTEFLNVLPSCFDGNMNAYVFCNKELLPQYLDWAVANKYSYNVLVWKKPGAIPIGGSHYPDIEYLCLFRKNAIWNGGLNGVSYSRCLEYNRETGLHPTMKPIKLITNELLISSNEGSNVLDLFGGSGSTVIACEQINRKCFIVELSPKYCDVIIQRWENFTGKKARLLNQNETMDL